MEVRNRILEYWFGSLSALEDDNIPSEKIDLWFGGDNLVDQEIRERFGKDLESAANGDYDHWNDQPRGRLAMVILLDQFSRNIHRRSPRAFAYDEQALEVALDGIDAGHDMALAPVARSFFYLPLEHSEELGHQERCVQLMDELRQEVPDEKSELFDAFFDYAVKHRDIIAKFGRFPHRNAILGRPSTPAEAEYLADGAETFGQG